MDATDEVTGPINLGNPGEFTIVELAEMVKRFTNSRSSIRLEPLPADDPVQRRPDITRARELLVGSRSFRLSKGCRGLSLISRGFCSGTGYRRGAPHEAGDAGYW
jgi:UDP-glucuronate decarboxylase